jgi:hypothetical protein
VEKSTKNLTFKPKILASLSVIKAAPLPKPLRGGLGRGGERNRSEVFQKEKSEK